MFELKMGIYQHYKGPLYQVLGLAHDANADEFFMDNGYVLYEGGRTCVVYIGLQLDAAHLGPRLAVRSLDDFLQSLKVHKIDKTICTGLCNLRGREHHWFGPRFQYLGPELTQEML